MENKPFLNSRSNHYYGSIHVGWHPDGRKKTVIRSLKTRDYTEAERVMRALQTVADEALKAESGLITRKKFERMVESVIIASGATIENLAPTFAEYSQRVIEHAERAGRSESTLRAYRSHMKIFQAWLQEQKMSHLSMSAIQTTEIQAWYNSRIDSGTAVGTANNAMKTVHRVFQQAVDWKLLDHNPVKAVTQVDGHSTPKEPFSIDDVGKIFACLHTSKDQIEFGREWELCCLVAATTGAREVDAKNMQWQNFSQDCRVITFKQQKTKGEVYFLLPPWARDKLRESRTESSGQYLCPNLRQIRAGKRGLGWRFRQILDLASVPYLTTKPKGPGGNTQYSKGFHSWRSFLSTELDADGVSEFTNQLITGHDDRNEKRKYIRKEAQSIYSECENTFERIGDAIGNK